jgi:hypothetical protein
MQYDQLYIDGGWVKPRLGHHRRHQRGDRGRMGLIHAVDVDDRAVLRAGCMLGGRHVATIERSTSGAG